MSKRTNIERWAQLLREYADPEIFARYLALSGPRQDECRIRALEAALEKFRGMIILMEKETS